MTNLEQIKESANYIKNKIKAVPQVAIVLGSGLGGFDRELSDRIDIDYKLIPYFQESTVESHDSRIAFGSLNGKNILCMCGRFHYYEGYSYSDVTHYIRVLKVLGVKTLILSCATGGINSGFSAGDIALVNDHIKFFDESPLRGRNLDFFGERFPDMSEAYSKKLIDIARKCAKEENITLKDAVYAYMPGPSYETPAEIRMLKTLGADIVGMSTVPEVIAARHCGINILCISCVTNMAAGISKNPLSMQEVIESGNAAKGRIFALVKSILRNEEF